MQEGQSLFDTNHQIIQNDVKTSADWVLQTQGGCFRPPSRRLSRPSTAQRAGSRPMSGQPSHASQIAAGGSHDTTASEQNQGLVVRGGRKVQSARASERVVHPTCVTQRHLPN